MKIFLSVLVLICLVQLSCQPEISGLKSKPDPVQSLSEFTEKNRSAGETFSIQGNSEISLTTSRGTKLSIPANAFATKEGKPVTGKINLFFKEIFTPAEMILNDLPTMSNDMPLESGGEFYIKATENDQPLNIKPGSRLQIEWPKTAIDMKGMQVFNGLQDADGNINWMPDNNPGNFIIDSILFSHSSLFSDNVNWINCDKFINSPTVSFTAYPGNLPVHDSTNIFIQLTGRNTVVKMSWKQGLNCFTTDKMLAMPSTIIGMCVKDGQFYVSITPCNVQDGQSITMHFSPLTESELKARLAQLH